MRRGPRPREKDGTEYLAKIGRRGKTRSFSRHRWVGADGGWWPQKLLSVQGGSTARKGLAECQFRQVAVRSGTALAQKLCHKLDGPSGKKGRLAEDRSGNRGLGYSYTNAPRGYLIWQRVLVQRVACETRKEQAGKVWGQKSMLPGLGERIQRGFLTAIDQSCGIIRAKCSTTGTRTFEGGEKREERKWNKTTKSNLFRGIAVRNMHRGGHRRARRRARAQKKIWRCLETWRLE